MGLNFAIYESTKTFSESPFFQMNSKNVYKEGLGDGNTKTEGTLSAVLRKGLCGAIAGGTSKFIVYPLVSHFSIVYLFLTCIISYCLFPAVYSRSENYHTVPPQVLSASYCSNAADSNEACT
jgi:hypothetical protein